VYAITAAVVVTALATLFSSWWSAYPSTLP
jgi:hypothetical protein